LLIEQGNNAEEQAGILSRVFFCFVTSRIQLGWNKTLTFEDLGGAAKQDREEVLNAAISDMWQKEKQKPDPKLSRVIFKFIRWPIIQMVFLQSISAAITFYNPMVVKNMLLWFALPYTADYDAFLEQMQLVSPNMTFSFPPVVPTCFDGTDSDLACGWKLAAMLFGLPLAGSIVDAQASLLAIRCYMQLRAITSTLVYRKSLVIPVLNVNNEAKFKEAAAAKAAVSNSNRKELAKADKNAKQATIAAEKKEKEKKDEPLNPADLSTGQILNLQASDGENIGRMAMSVTNGFIVPFQIAALLWRLYATFLDKEAAELAGRDPNTKAANAAFVGLGVMFLSLPLMGVVLGLTAKAKQDQLVASDQRVRATTEALQGIRVLKFYGWERATMEYILSFRVAELKAIWMSNFLAGMMSLVTPPVLIL
jgi:hypothetical protein